MVNAAFFNYMECIFMIVVIMFYQHKNIEKDLLDANSSYAMKMSDVMSSYIEMAQSELGKVRTSS